MTRRRAGFEVALDPLERAPSHDAALETLAALEIQARGYYGANRAVPNYNVMGPVKAALEAVCRYLAYELGPSGIRVHAISSGPLKTRAASGLKDFELLLNEAAHRAPLGELVDVMDVGFSCAYLASPFARRITGGTVYIDGGTNIVA